ncbi:MAG: nucleotidyltransferase [Leptolinea sp.]|jgi:predicted nucleotidyltransferase|nr:nucleotidyltransferase [Leptolinea sp.]
MYNFDMNIDQIRKLSPQLYTIARKFGIARISIFGSIARGDSSQKSDVDFLLDIKEGASLFGIAGFTYEAEKILGISVDAVPRELLSRLNDEHFVNNLLRDSLPL